MSMGKLSDQDMSSNSRGGIVKWRCSFLCLSLSLSFVLFIRKMMLSMRALVPAFLVDMV